MKITKFFLLPTIRPVRLLNIPFPLHLLGPNTAFLPADVLIFCYSHTCLMRQSLSEVCLIKINFATM